MEHPIIPAMEKDRNFDDLAPKFRRKVYGGLKGKIRLAVLKKDLNEFYPEALTRTGKSPLHILDAGGGYGPFSIDMAKLGHHITLWDLSGNMLDLAKERFSTAGVAVGLTACHGPIQDILPDPEHPFDLILCHAVLEWVVDPQGLIDHLMAVLPPGAVLSLTFYNLAGMIYKNLLRANYKKIMDKDYSGWPGSLTPTWPREPDMVLSWLSSHPVKLLCHSGIRVFHDYILDPAARDRDPETMMKLELELSRQPPYRGLGRYQHLLCMKAQANTRAN